MVEIRKRRPGAGAKRKATADKKDIILPVRLTSGQHDQLVSRAAIKDQQRIEKNPKAKKWTASRVARDALELGLQAMRERDHKKGLEQPTRALLWFIGRLAKRCDQETTGGQRFDWRTDPFVFAALRISILRTLEKLEPRGKSELQVYLKQLKDVPQWWLELFESPETLAAWAFGQEWDELIAVSSRSGGWGDREIDEYAYSIEDARKDLKIAHQPMGDEP